MTNIDEVAGFYEDDEPDGAVLGAYERADKGVTAPPLEPPAGQQVLVSSNFRSFRPALSPAGAPVRDQARSGLLVQA